ncbi:hypothetical protein Trydic_g22261 [Trypoxylus dichotomus]
MISDEEYLKLQLHKHTQEQSNYRPKNMVDTINRKPKQQEKQITVIGRRCLPHIKRYTDKIGSTLHKYNINAIFNAIAKLPTELP